MAPALLSYWKEKSTEKLDLYSCDLYSYGILVCEVFSQKKPHVKLNLTEENCYDLIVTKQKRPNIVYYDGQKKKRRKEEEKR